MTSRFFTHPSKIHAPNKKRSPYFILLFLFLFSIPTSPFFLLSLGSRVVCPSLSRPLQPLTSPLLASCTFPLRASLTPSLESLHGEIQHHKHYSSSASLTFAPSFSPWLCGLVMTGTHVVEVAPTRGRRRMERGFRGILLLLFKATSYD